MFKVELKTYEVFESEKLQYKLKYMNNDNQRGNKSNSESKRKQKVENIIYALKPEKIFVS